MESDFLVIGGGIAGASAAYELAARGRVVLVEREGAPGYHTTGRSAAMFLENYGAPVVRKLASASRAFLDAPPDGFAEHPLLSPRGLMYVARADQRAAVEAMLAATDDRPRTVCEIDTARALAMMPTLRPDYVAAALLEADAADIDVHALHGGFLRGLRARGGRVVADAEVTALDRRDGTWRAITRAGELSGTVVVNAAGAWADEIAGLAGITPVGLAPKRRTAFTFDPPEGHDVSTWPLVADIDEQFYFKPEAGRILGSPADETPMPPCDVQPDELDIAVAVDRIERATTFKIRRLTHRWAGLRSFVDDHLPVVGYAPEAQGFFWLAGQGGVGIMTSPAMARSAAALVCEKDLPEDLRGLGVRAADLAPDR
ncbi:MAG: NAD(P)/FAD-dependent oxidoreductase, partial [Alphaproteobacteria bacterium]